LRSSAALEGLFSYLSIDNWRLHCSAVLLEGWDSYLPPSTIGDYVARRHFEVWSLIGPSTIGDYVALGALVFLSTTMKVLSESRRPKGDTATRGSNNHSGPVPLGLHNPPAAQLRQQIATSMANQTFLTAAKRQRETSSELCVVRVVFLELIRRHVCAILQSIQTSDSNNV